MTYLQSSDAFCGIHSEDNFERVLWRRHAFLLAELDSRFCKFEWVLYDHQMGMFTAGYKSHTVAAASTAPANPPATNDTIAGV